MDFNQQYQRKDFLDFLESQFLTGGFKMLSEDLFLEGNFNFIKKVVLLGEDKNLGVKIFEAEHNSEYDPRVSLSKEAFRLMSNYSAGKALVVFVSPKSQNYRFSLITIDLKPKGNRIIQEFSNPRRYSFFLGPDSKTHTPNKFLIKDGRVKNFEDLLSRFAVEVVTKEFFREISNWYFWAVKNIAFPKDAEKDENGRNSIGVIRLITRIIFIWFMKEKKLVPDYLFNGDKIKEFLKDLSSKQTTYYRAILQNLFFATLNTPIKKRRFRKEGNYKGMNNDYNKQEFYRYEEYFKESNKIFNLFEKIPFLNGGLFECLDKKRERIIVDGFSRVKKNQPKVPNFLFFSEEKKIDLNSDYGTKNKKYKVRGLINILQSYNFTIDENTPIDKEVALDPELLGLVFENLLASYNPETSTTARKATGSYYTPRKIVDYMVEESLKAYFKNKLPEDEKIDDKLNNLFSYSEEGHQFNDNEVDILIKAINRLKVIDPAVGSGAFPMGVLQKLVFVLSKLDPHNKKWKQEQIDAVENNVSDAVIKRESIKKIESNFENNNLDYGRKLYLIQNCIYGVDIQITAIQISKLRFFISLLVDEKSDKNKENFGIEPLPNLETKFVAANSLIGLHSIGAVMLPDPRILKLEEELKKIRAKHFNANYKSEKERLRRKDKEIRSQLAELFEQSGFPSENTEKIINWDPYSPNISADFFDSEWMFGVEGFDIVIGNPPYVSYGLRGVGEMDSQYKKYLIEHFSNSAEYKISLYAIFMELAINLNNPTGNSTYIVPDSFLLGRYFSKIRNYILQKCNIKYLMLIKSKVFENTTVGQSVVYLFQKDNKKNSRTDIILVEDEKQISNKTFIKNSYSQEYFKSIEHNRFRMVFDKKTFNIVDKMDNVKNKKFISDVIKFRSGLISKIGQDKIKSDHKISDLWGKGILSGSCVNNFYVNYKGSFLCYDKSVIKSGGIETVNYFESKLFVRQTGDKLICAFDNEKLLAINNIHIGNKITKNCELKYIASLLNSKLLNFYYKKISLEEGRTMAQIDIEMLEKLPIPEISLEQQKPFINLVDQILKNKKDNPNADTSDLEKEIDQLVYKLYNLTKEEIKIIGK